MLRLLRFAFLLAFTLIGCMSTAVPTSGQVIKGTQETGALKGIAPPVGEKKEAEKSEAHKDKRGMPNDEPGKKENHDEGKKRSESDATFWLGISFAIALFVVGILYVLCLMLTVWIWPRSSLAKNIQTFGTWTMGVPAAAWGSFVLVTLLPFISNQPVRLEIAGWLTLEGAGSQLLFWNICFLSLAIVIKLLTPSGQLIFDKAQETDLRVEHGGGQQRNQPARDSEVNISSPPQPANPPGA